MQYSNNIINNQILFLNFSDSIDHTVQDIVSFNNRIEDINYIDKFSGFFFNIRNITKVELENFLVFYGADINMLMDPVFMRNILVFFSYFLNESILSYVMTIVTLPELYLLFNNKLLGKSSIIKISTNFNNNIRIEVYRFFLTFRLKYKFLNLKRFKSLILSTVFFFDDNNSLYHYYYFNNKKNYDWDLEERRQYKEFYNDLLQGKMGFLDLLYLKVDNLVYNLYNLNQVLANYAYTYENNKVIFKYFDMVNKVVRLPYKLSYKLYLNSLVSYFFFLHEIITFFRYYMFIFFLLCVKNVSISVILKYYKYFKMQFNNMVIFYKIYYNKFYSLICNIIYLLYNYIRKYIYLLLNGNDRNIYYFLFLNFQYFLLKFFNLIQLFIIKEKITFNGETIVWNFNTFLFNKLKNMVSIGNFEDLLNLRQSTLLVEDNALYTSRLLNSLMNTSKLPFFFKFFFYLYKFRLSFNFIYVHFYSKYIYKLFTLRTYYYYDLDYLKDGSLIIKNTLLTHFNITFNNIISYCVNTYLQLMAFSQFKQILVIFPIKFKSLFLPQAFITSAVIDDFFFY